MYRLLNFCGALFFTSYCYAQMVSYTLQQSFTKAQLDSLFSSSGFSLPVSAQYGVEVYQVIY
jgi:hypothetical protein